MSITTPRLISLAERTELRYIATALNANDRHEFLPRDALNDHTSPTVHRVASRALCQAAYANEIHRFGRLMRVLDPNADGPAALAQAVMADHPQAVAKLLAWGTPVVKGGGLEPGSFSEQPHRGCVAGEG